MTLPPQDIPDDLDACHQLIDAQQATIDQLQSQLDQVLGTSDQQADTIQKQQKQIDKLRHELELFKRRIFGQRRERFVEDPRQQPLFDLGEMEEESARVEDEERSDEPPKQRRRGHGRRRLPKEIRRKVIPCELAAAELPCPCCGKPRVKVSERLSEQLDYQPAVLFVNQYVRHVYACPDDNCQPNMVTAPKPRQPIEKGLAGPGLLAFVASSKLADHLPLNRLEDIISRFGIHIARSTQCDWMAACAELVRPLYTLMVRLVLESKVLGTDDTTVPLQDDARDRTATAYFWAYVGDDDHPYTCYDFTASRSRDGPQEFLGDFAGYLQSDGYSGYLGIVRDSDGRIHNVGCWSHARRYFDRARDAAPTRVVHEALSYIGRLYDVEHQVDERAAKEGWDAHRMAAERLAMSHQRSTVILREFQDWLDAQQAQAVPSSPLAKAIYYTLNQWDTENDLPELLPDRWIELHPQHRLAHREREADQADQRRRDRRARRRKLQRAKAK